MDFMSDKEAAILDDKLVWVVWPPIQSTDLSALCAVLQERLEADGKYLALHCQQVSLDLFDKMGSAVIIVFLRSMLAAVYHQRVPYIVIYKNLT